MEAVALDRISLERIGRTFNEVTEDLLDAPLPQPIANRVPEVNILCTLGAVLAHCDSYEIVERNGEVFIEQRS